MTKKTPVPKIKHDNRLLFVGVLAFAVACAESHDTEDDEVTEYHSDSATDVDTDSSTEIPTDFEDDEVDVDLIDDMESGSGRIIEQDGRKGVWYVFNDEMAEQWPPLTEPGSPAMTDGIPGGRGESTRAMHTVGRIMPDEGCCDTPWGAGIGFDLMYDGLQYEHYDASAYDGLTFWGWSFEPVEVPLRLGTVDDVSTEWGGDCPYEGECRDHPTALVPFTTTWTKFWVFFYTSDSVKGLYSSSETWEKTAVLDDLLNIQFYFHPSRNVSDFDFWIDDIAFFKGEPDCGRPDTACLFEPHKP